MSLNEKQIKALFSDIRTGKAALLLGQEYLKIDNDYYQEVLCKLGIKGENPSLNELWKSNTESFDKLGGALLNAAEHSEYKPWLRSLLSLGWNVIVSSSINNQWVKHGVGNNFSLIIQTQEELNENIDFYKIFNKKQPHFISLYSDESSIPDNKKLLRLKKQTNLIKEVYEQFLANYNGYLIVDGIAEDDWFDIGRLIENIDSIPYSCIYIFGMDERRLARVCKDEDDLTLLQDCVENGQIILHDNSLKNTIIDVGLVIDDIEEDEFEHDNEVRISLGNDDTIWVSRNECTLLNRLGITLMRDEILTQLIINDSNKERYFAEFLQQRDKKNWSFFDIFFIKINKVLDYLFISWQMAV